MLDGRGPLNLPSQGRTFKGKCHESKPSLRSPLLHRSSAPLLPHLLTFLTLSPYPLVLNPPILSYATQLAQLSLQRGTCTQLSASLP